MGVPGSAAAGRDKPPLSAAQAWTIILDGVRSGSWRILAGEDAKTIEVCDRCGEFGGAEASQGVWDALVRVNLETACACAELGRMAAQAPAATTPER